MIAGADDDVFRGDSRRESRGGDGNFAIELILTIRHDMDHLSAAFSQHQAIRRSVRNCHDAKIQLRFANRHPINQSRIALHRTHAILQENAVRAVFRCLKNKGRIRRAFIELMSSGSVIEVSFRHIFNKDDVCNFRCALVVRAETLDQQCRIK